MRVERVIKLEKLFAEEVHNIYKNAARFRWSADQINKYYKEGILENDLYRRLPRYSKTFIDGVRYILDKQHWSLVCYSYSIEGKRMLTSDPNYRKLSAKMVYERWSHTGCFVYIDDVTKFYTYPLYIEERFNAV